jgi:HEPN domain-containing protein
VSFEEAELLKRRAESFLKNAQRLIEEGEPDIALFGLEQYCQLILKYKLLVYTGSYPRTHSLRQLIRELGKVNPNILVLVNDIKNLHYIARLEEAYISSRYLPYTYTTEEVKDISRFVHEVFKPIVDSI